MKTEDILSSLSIKEKLFQMFILGFPGQTLSENIVNSIKSGLGGIILFTENINSYEQAAELTTSLQKQAKIPLFVSIDQEGGRVERTLNIKNKLNYLSAGELKSPEHSKIQTEIMSQELLSMGINMNFAPVIDVNTNPNNPIIGIRSYGNTPQKVTEFAQPVYQTFINNSIIPVAKHFPGHGDTKEDSHLTMPIVDIPFEELEKTHIEPFKHAIKNGINAVMISHVHYTAFNKEITPASLSEKIITNYLRNSLGFNGIVISDDMVMGGIKNHFDTYEACTLAIKAGVDIFIFRDSADKTLEVIEQLNKSIEKGKIPEERINQSVKRILDYKYKFNFWKNQANQPPLLNIQELQQKINNFQETSS